MVLKLKKPVFLASNTGFFISLALLGLILWLEQAQAQTYVSGPIDYDTIWTEPNSPYVVTGDVTVLEGVTLTIEPGVVVKFYGSWLTVEGTLIADGPQLRIQKVIPQPMPMMSKIS